MKEILTVILFVFIFMAIVLAILFHEKVRLIKQMLRQAAEARAARREAEEEEYFKRTSTKYYRKPEDEEPQFAKDYFKGTEQKPKEKSKQKQKAEATARHTTTDSGVTIIDSRSEQKADHKIFDDSEGEYVEFEEVK